MRDALATVWACFDTVEPRFSAAEVALWTPGDRQSLVGLGILIESTPALRIVCPACDLGHVEDVVVDAADGEIRRFIACPEAGRVAVVTAHLRTWTIDCDEVAHRVAKGLGLSGQATEVVPCVLWRLGTSEVGPDVREVFFARNPPGADHDSLRRRVGKPGRAIVLWGGALPSTIEWKGRVPAQATLAQLVSLKDGVLDGHGLLLGDLVRSHDRQLERDELASPEPAPSKKNIQRMINTAVDKKSLIDLVIGAVLSTENYDEAGKQIENTIHQKFSRHQVFRVIKKLGGLPALRGKYGTAPKSAVASRPSRRSRGT